MIYHSERSPIHIHNRQLHSAKHHFSTTPSAPFPSEAAVSAAAIAAAGAQENGTGGDATPPTPYLYGAIAPIVLGEEQGEQELRHGEGIEEEEKRRLAALYRLRQWRRGENELTYAQVCY